MILIEEQRQSLSEAAESIKTMTVEVSKVSNDREEKDKIEDAIILLKSKGFKVMYPFNGWRSF